MQLSGRQLMGTILHQGLLEVMVPELEGLVQEKVGSVQSSKLTSTGYRRPFHSCSHHESKSSHKAAVWVPHSTQTSTDFRHLHRSCCRLGTGRCCRKP